MFHFIFIFLEYFKMILNNVTHLKANLMIEN